ncbi:methionine--tRNA ligase [Deltaproteobacteria bacterium]|nr:methionine--tRNA ligase [Deltaproteobacteria bacterium]
MSERFYITTPIYYVNDVPHIGHAYTTIAADVAARWHRINGHDVRFLTGTDEHGQKVMRAAEKLGRTPQEHVDITVKRFEALWAKLNIQVDDFIRTTEPRHQRVVQGFLQQLHDKGELYRKKYAGWYSTSAERFWSDEEVEAKTGAPIADIRAGKVVGLCPDSGQPVEWVTEENYFFRMSAYQERLIAWIEANPRCIAPESRKNEVLGFLRKPLEDLCISRPKARLSWGIPLPFDEDYVTYVWFDALSNYVSALGPPEGGLHRRFWPADVHLVGKDILTFHTVYWFSMLFALGLEPPRQVFAHGWWTIKKEKMSKSIGNVIDPNRLVEVFGVDATRYFLLREIPFGNDGDYSPESALLRFNSDLVNDFSNLVHRVVKWSSTPLAEPAPLNELDAQLQATARRATESFRAHMDGLEFRDALQALWELVSAGNKYVDTVAPWALAKSGDTARLAEVLRMLRETQRIVVSHLAAFCPASSAEVLTRLGLSAPDLSAEFDVLPTGSTARAGDPLFMRLDNEATIEALGGAPAKPAAPKNAPKTKEKPVSDPTPATTAPAAPAPGSTLISYDDFAKVALRIGVIVSAEKHPNADRLLVLKVDVGEETPRQIVAGIAKVYEPEALVGKRIVVVVNLAPAKLRGVESQGMLLAAGGSDVASLLTPIHEVPAGSVVK